jgi:hypothetical protein
MSLMRLVSQMAPLQKRILVLAVVPLVLVSFLGLCLMPIWYSFDAQREWRAEARKALASTVNAEQSQSSLQEQLSSLSHSALWSKLYEASSDSSAGSTLQADVSAVLRAQQVEPQMLTPLATTVEGQFKKIGARFTCSARIDQLQRILAGLAAHSRYLRVERLKISSPQSQQPNENSPLAVILDVTGYQLVHTSSTAQDASSSGARP